MIISISPLPNYYPDGAIVAGETETFIDCASDGFFGHNLVLNRDIKCLASLRKYKAIIAISGIFGEFIFISDRDIGEHWTGSAIYPIYIYMDSTLLLCTDGINRLFADKRIVVSHPGTERVVTREQFYSEIAGVTGWGNACLDSSPLAIGERRGPNPLEIATSVTSGDGVFEENLRYLNTSLQENGHLIALNYIRSAEMLTPLMANSLSNLANAQNLYASINASMWEQRRMYIETHDILLKESGDIYVSHPEFSSMSRMLSELFAVGCSEFVFKIRTDERDISDYHIDTTNILNGGNRKTLRLSDWYGLVDYLIEAANLISKFGDTNMNLYGHRTNEEELIIYDHNTNEPVLYLDLVWWILASGDGLVDIANYHQIGGNLC